ncbi:MAG: SDR family oxidoreductase [Candidatus Yanofskybacteria bacterium]|nr:SDR family oxidoreductase [Candidatus Yanofskybacteria bacterium]
MTTILMTGVTGTVMGPVAALLLKEGHTILALVRSGSRVPTEISCHRRFVVIQGDITENLAGVLPSFVGEWRGKVHQVLHGAASVKFIETPQKEVWRTNVTGTQNVLWLAKQLGVPQFHHVSTAYVCGDSEFFSEDDLPVGVGRNAYEESKIVAERMVREGGFSYSIYRIPVVVGDSQTGMISSFTGYYGFFAPFFELHHALRQKWVREPEKLGQAGIWVKEGRVYLPIAVPCSLRGPLNIVPLDWVARMMSRAVTLRAEGETFHITHPNPPAVRSVIANSLRYLGFDGMRPGEEPSGREEGLARSLQEGIRRNIQPYRPYTTKEREVFHDKRLREALGSSYEEPPSMLCLIPTLLRFALERNFGRSEKVRV